jgi:hypothetical protein
MDFEWSTLDKETLQRILQHEQQNLQQALLAAEPWNYIADQQRHIIQLSIALRNRSGDDADEFSTYTS